MTNILKINAVVLLGVFFLASCNGCNAKGDGHVVTRIKEVKPFTKLTIEGIFPVELLQDGSSEWVKVEADENLQQLITTENNGDELIVKTKEKAAISRSTKMKVYINIKDLRDLDFKSVGNLSTSKTLKLDSLELHSESVGRLNLNMTGKYLRANLNSIGSTTLAGKVDEVRINNKSIGSLSAYEMKAGMLMIHNTAVGSVEIYADSAFYIRSSSIGTLTYKGPGVVKELNSEGLGKVKKEE